MFNVTDVPALYVVERGKVVGQDDYTPLLYGGTSQTFARLDFFVMDHAAPKPSADAGLTDAEREAKNAKAAEKKKKAEERKKKAAEKAEKEKAKKSAEKRKQRARAKEAAKKKATK